MHLPPQVLAVMDGVDAILHAGDVEDVAVLQVLRRLAPVYAVRGNLHWQFTSGVHDQNLPASLRFRWKTQRIWMTHGHINFGTSVIDKVMSRLDSPGKSRINDYMITRLGRMRPAATTAVIFGHSHHTIAREVDGVLFYNPGAVAVRISDQHEGPHVGCLTLGDDGALIPAWTALNFGWHD